LFLSRLFFYIFLTPFSAFCAIFCNQFYRGQFMKTHALILFLLLALTLVSAAPTAEAGEDAAVSLIEADQQLSKAWAARGAAEAVSEFATDETAMLAAGANLITGREKIRAHMASEPQWSISNWQMLKAEVSGAADLGYTFGAFQYSENNKKGHAAYFFTWRKPTGGAWKLAAIVRNPASEPPTATAKTYSKSASAYKSSAYKSGGGKADVESAREAIMKADSDFSMLSVERGAAAAFSWYIADEGTLLWVSGQGIKGKAAIEAAFQPGPRKATLVWKPSFGFMSASADLGYTIGLSENRVEAADGKQQVRYGKYLTVWKKQTDGSWKFVIDGGNSTPPPKG
jgi:ketosteroid isomerase-like protein